MFHWCMKVAWTFWPKIVARYIVSFATFVFEDWFSLTIIFFWLGRRWLGICKMFSACMVFVLYLSLIVVNYLTVSAFPSVGTKDAVWTHLQTFFCYNNVINKSSYNRVLHLVFCLKGGFLRLVYSVLINRTCATRVAAPLKKLMIRLSQRTTTISRFEVLLSPL